MKIENQEKFFLALHEAVFEQRLDIFSGVISDTITNFIERNGTPEPDQLRTLMTEACRELCAAIVRDTFGLYANRILDIAVQPLSHQAKLKTALATDCLELQNMFHTKESLK